MGPSAQVTHIGGFPLSDFGDTMRVEGVIVGNGHEALELYLPGEGFDFIEPLPYVLNTDEALAWLKASDDPVAPLYERGAQNVSEFDRASFVKAIIRKGSRQVDQAVAWAVYRRDGFECRYCGANDRPLTYDHLLAQAWGGQTTVANGVSACKPCNKAKGHKTIDEWVEHMKERGMKYGEYWANYQAESRQGLSA